MIISASRRTDIPAFYHEWFLYRIKEGFLLTKNPYNHQVKRISLLPQEVDAIVFWTRNPGKMIPELNQLQDFNYYFQYTITGYPKILDSHGLNPYKAISIFQELSKKIGSQKVIWRYDPIIISNVTPLSEHKRLFKKIATSLAGYTNRVVISFADLYKKTEKNLRLIPNFTYRDITNYHEELSELCFFLSNIAHQYDMKISSCAESLNLDNFGIEKGKCIDNRLLKELFDINILEKKDPGQREFCGCVKSVDIGQYNTCLHGCRYCYATFNDKIVKNNMKKHNPHSPFILGEYEEKNHNSHSEIIIQHKLF
ncbi:DUF1848 domain-containing protein [Proteus alimentorum]|uniref:DUF1848 domain-containing protein n=1 Tax=Proteus alimentorum TaxID=1973495 RepID=UPI000C000973|nr:DUF1848 domain-containing protein [Proteus alimentorum]